jgi:AcrR family transcriptional regulator
MTTQYAGSGDPARSLALLWRSDLPAARRGRSELGVDAIVRAAVELADADGLAALSMRRVAERLGVGTMSLYTHVPGKAELLDLMLDTAYGELPVSEQSVSGGPATGDPPGWRDRLAAMARANWALYQRHPWLLQVATSRPPLGPHATAKYERELAAVEGLGLTDVEMDSVVTLVNSYVHGAARGAVDAAEAARRTGVSDEQWWSAHAPLLARVLDPRRFPVATRVGAAVGDQFQTAYQPDHAFEFGLARVLDGVSALLRHPAG